MAFKASEITSSINSMLHHLEESDQPSLLDVIEDYFTNPFQSSADSDSDSDHEFDVAANVNGNHEQ